MSINVCAPGHWDWYDSYGLIACRLARHLTRLGAHVNAWGLGFTAMANQPADVAAVTGGPRRPALGGIFLGYPTSYARHGALAAFGPKVALTMFESSRLPQEWIAPLNGCDAVIVPSRFCGDVFRESGVTAPLHVIPLGVSEVYRPAVRRKDGPFTFLAFLDRGRRKGGIHAMQAFVRAFGDDPAYRLLLKMRAPKVKVEILNPNIEIVQRDLSEHELAALYARADVLVNPNMGEGFGLIPREFAASGGVALTTGWGGTADDLPAWGWPLPYTLVPAMWEGNKTLAGQDLGVWAEPDVDGVAAMMREVAANRDEYAWEALGKAQAAHSLYDWDAFARRVLTVWEEVASGYRTGTRQAA